MPGAGSRKKTRMSASYRLSSRALGLVLSTAIGFAPVAGFAQAPAQRVERLLLRHEEIERTNALLTEQVQQLTQERDSLKSRLAAARARVDDLHDRLPLPQNGSADADNTGDEA